MIYAICTQFRNEMNKLEPWLLYNIHQGFNTFILYDDYSTDKSLEVIENIAKKNKINIIINKTDKIGETFENSLQTDQYINSASLAKRVARSFLRGFDVFKKLTDGNNDSFCAFVDVDECLTSDTDMTVVETIKNLFKKGNVNHLCVHSFDVDTCSLKTDKNLFVEESTTNRWSEKEKITLSNGKFSDRVKSIVTPNHDFMVKNDSNPWTTVHVAGIPTVEYFRKNILSNPNKNCKINELRINHYRIPPYDNIKTFSQKDTRVFNTFQKILSQKKDQ